MMLRINRIKAISRTEVTNYGFDYSFGKGLNLISSHINTRGKSSVLLVVYYCLGLEEIIGGRGKKTLTSVFKNYVKDANDVSHTVLESEAWLEISNGSEIVSLRRTAEMEGRNENLISVYFSPLDNAHSPKTYREDMYVHSPNSTTSSRGFHAFLEKFIGFELPLVPSNDGNEYKLYMQLLFSGMFIEQKRGWADIFSAMPILNIKEAKKRTLEYILGLETLSNEKKRANLKHKEALLKYEWEQICREADNLCTREDCRISGVPQNPCILDGNFNDKICVVTIADKRDISEELTLLEKRLGALSDKTPRIIDNFDALQNELEKTEHAILGLEAQRDSILRKQYLEKSSVKKLEDNLAVLDADLRNNKDALKLKKMGSEMGISSYSDTCPICGQTIQDSLLPMQNYSQTMSIEDNIKHLESQRAMIEFAINAHRQNISVAEDDVQSISGRLFTLRRLAKTIRSDLFSVDENLSATVVYEKINIEGRIIALGKLRTEIDRCIVRLKEVSNDWAKYLADKRALPKTNFTDKDKEKVDALEANFKYYIKAFNYRSASSLDKIEISRDNYLPISEGFDMKFDSSASDNIRAIWAFTLALLKTSIEKGGNHPQIVIFDEPGQHSIVTADMVSLFQEVIKLSDSQIIIGITLNDSEIRKAVAEIAKEEVPIVDVGNHAFKVC